MTRILMVVLLSVSSQNDHGLPPSTSVATAEFNTLGACNDTGSKLYLRLTAMMKDRIEVIWSCEPKGQS
jgi:hypothetical protein